MTEFQQTAIRWLIAWLVALAALAGFHFIVVARAADNLEASRSQVAGKIERYNLLRGAGSTQEQGRLKRQQDELAEQYTSFVFDANALSKLDFEIRNMAEEKGLSDFEGRRVGTVTAIGKTKLTRIAQRNLVLSFSGSYADVLGFVNSLERNYPVVFVDQFTLQLAEEGQAGLSCTMECSVIYDTTVD